MLSKEQLEVEYRFPFGDSAISVLQTAEEEARRLQHHFIGTEHLLLGYLSCGNTEILSTFRIFPAEIREAVLFLVGTGNWPMGVGEQIGFTPRAETVIQLSVKEAKRLHDNVLNPDHLVLGMIREGEGIAATTLEQFGVRLPKVTPPKSDSLRIIRAFLANPAQNPAAQEQIRMIIDGAAGVISNLQQKQRRQ